MYDFTFEFGDPKFEVDIKNIITLLIIFIYLTKLLIIREYLKHKVIHYIIFE